MNYHRETGKQFIFVSPLNALSKQVGTKNDDIVVVVNQDTTESGVTVFDYAVDMISDGKSIIISYKTYLDYIDYFINTGIQTYIDECHFLLNEELEKDDKLCALSNADNIVLLSATPYFINELLYGKYECIETKIDDKYHRVIKPLKLESRAIDSIASTIDYVLKDKDKDTMLVVLINSREKIAKLKELYSKDYKVEVYTSTEKTIEVNGEYFSKDADIILTTKALTTGVSLRNNMTLLYIATDERYDTINELQQFFSRYREYDKIDCYLAKVKWSKSKFGKPLTRATYKGDDLYNQHTYRELVLLYLGKILMECNIYKLSTMLNGEYKVTTHKVNIKTKQYKELSKYRKEKLDEEIMRHHFLIGVKVIGRKDLINRINLMVELKTNMEYRKVYEELIGMKTTDRNYDEEKAYDILNGMTTSSMNNAIMKYEMNNREISIVDLSCFLEHKVTKEKNKEIQEYVLSKDPVFNVKTINTKSKLKIYLEKQGLTIVKRKGYYYITSTK
jgi:hypothetical protein